MSKNTFYLEVEQKYKADKIGWDKFVSKLSLIGPSKQMRVTGPDTYYSINGRILRWRRSPDKSELTIKTRHSETDSFIRDEIDLNADNNSAKTVIKWLNILGCKKLFRIYKDCHIFWFDRKEGRVSIVIYDVRCRGHKTKRFVEIEAEKGQDFDKSKKLVRRWEKIIKLKPSQRLKKNLYEIYSGKPLPMSESVKKCTLCKKKKHKHD